MWKKVKDKPAPLKPQMVLCADLKCLKSNFGCPYEVLIHWPDGVWTDIHEDEIETDFLPDLWQEIEKPNVEIAGK